MSETEHDPAEPVEPVEPTEPEPEPENEPEPEPAENEPEPEPAPEGPSPEDVEAMFKKIGTAFSAYTRKVGDAMGDDAVDLLPCPVCSEAVPGFVNKHQVGQFPDDVRRQVMRFLGFATEQEYEASQTTRRCEVCAGKGKVTTGSTVPNHETAPCPTCTGYGYVPPPSATTGVNIAQPGNGAVAAPLTLVSEQPEVDEHGEALILPDGRENPNYGKMPHRKVLVEPWGVTAHLRAEPAYQPVPGEVIES